MGLNETVTRNLRNISNEPPKHPSLHSGGFHAGTDKRGYANPRSRNGGLPANPVPLINRLAPDVKGGPLVGLKRFIPIPAVDRDYRILPVALPRPFRTAPELPQVGKITKGLGGTFRGVQDAINLHAAILPSNPMAFSLINQVQETFNPVVDNKPTLRSALSRVTGFVGSVRNTVESTAQNRSPM